VFIDRQLIPLTKQFPNLKIVFEHITTQQAVDFVLEAGAHIGATITPQHLLLNRNALLVGGIHPHNYCLPVLKRESHRQALLAAATSGNPKFFLGTDSAPHGKGAKESACGCAGIYSAHAALEFYATAFEQAGALDKLEGFASHFGPDFYGLPRNSGSVTLERREQPMVEEIPFGEETLVPFMAGENLPWRLL
jgi:dihydroorotase